MNRSPNVTVIAEWHTRCLMSKYLRFGKNRAELTPPMDINPKQKIIMSFWLTVTILQGAAISPFKEFKGLDDSYFWLISQSAKNMSIAKGEQFLTMGPLGFLDLADPTWHLGYSLSVIFKVMATVVLWHGLNQKFNEIYKNYNIKYINTTILVTFFSLVNPASINFAIGMFLYKHKNKLVEKLSWASLIYILFFVKYLPFVLAILFYGLRIDLHKHFKKIITINVLFLTAYIGIAGIESFSKMIIGSYEVVKGYANMRSDNLAYLNHYLYFILFIIIIMVKIFKQFTKLQKLSLTLIFIVIFKYGFVRHDVFHIIVTFSILTALSVYILNTEYMSTLDLKTMSKTFHFFKLLIIITFVFYSIHAQTILPFSKFNFLILGSIFVFLFININQLVYLKFFKYYTAVLVATFAISGITPLNPVMPTVIKSSPFSVLERTEWTHDSLISVFTNNSKLLQDKYIKLPETAILTKTAHENSFSGNFIQISYTTPLNLERKSKLKELYPPSNPTSTFTNKLDQINTDWITRNSIDWIFFDGKSIGQRQLLNDSPNFFKYIACNYSVFKEIETYLILKKNTENKCIHFNNSIINYGGPNIYSINASDFVYLEYKSDFSLTHKLLFTIFKPLNNLYMNNKIIFLKDNGNKTLIRIPQELDFPGKFSLNGDASLDLKFTEKSFSNVH